MAWRACSGKTWCQSSQEASAKGNCWSRYETDASMRTSCQYTGDPTYVLTEGCNWKKMFRAVAYAAPLAAKVGSLPMSVDRVFRLFDYATLGLSCVALVFAEASFLPDLQVYLAPVLALLVLAWWVEERW